MADVDADADAAFFLYYNRCCFFFFFSTQSRVYLFFISVSVPHLLDAAIQWKRIQAFFDAFFP